MQQQQPGGVAAGVCTSRCVVATARHAARCSSRSRCCCRVLLQRAEVQGTVWLGAARIEECMDSAALSPPHCSLSTLRERALRSRCRGRARGRIWDGVRHAQRGRQRVWGDAVRICTCARSVPGCSVPDLYQAASALRVRCTARWRAELLLRRGLRTAESVHALRSPSGSLVCLQAR